MEKIRKLKKTFGEEKIDGYLIPKNDEFFDEYLPPYNDVMTNSTSGIHFKPFEWRDLNLQWMWAQLAASEEIPQVNYLTIQNKDLNDEICKEKIFNEILEKLNKKNIFLNSTSGIPLLEMPW